MTEILQEKTGIIRDKQGKFTKGSSGNVAGRPRDTPGQKIIKIAVKEYLKDYEQGLAEALPKISPVLIKQAKEGNLKAIIEIHQVLGLHETKGASSIAAVQINIAEDRTEFGR